MSLLNAALAFGAFAFTIPLVIHLFFRSRFKTVDWGAMYLLESVVRVNRRRMQVTNLLLLLLRCLIPVLLAFCLARPVWTGLRALAGDSPKTLVIALDDSRSMSITPPGEESRIELAKKEIRSVLEGLSRRDEVMIVRGSRLGTVPSKMGVSDALSKLRKFDAQGGPVSIGKLIEAAQSAAEEGSHPRRQVLVVSDFQAASVDTSTLEIAGRIKTQNELESASNNASRLIIDMLDVGEGWAELANVSVDAVSIDSPVVVSQRSGVYSATLRNSADVPANDLRIVWSIDGTPLEPRVISIDAKSTATNRLTHTIDAPGMHEVALTVSHSDVLMEDNRRSVAVEVMEEINVLLVDGKPSKEPLRGQADFLAIALSPFAFGGDDRPDPVRASVASDRKLAEELSQNDVRVVMLCGVGRLADSAKRALVDFVHSGGALVVFDGANVRQELFNAPWKSSAGISLSFPARLGKLIGDPDGDVAGENSIAIDKPSPLYRPWSILAPAEQNPFSSVGVSAFRDLSFAGPGESQQEESPESLSSAREFVLLKSTAGDPLAVVGQVGEGTVVQFAISGNDDWTNLPLRPVFLPMVQQLVLDLAGKHRNAMIDVGEPIVIHRDEWSQPNHDELSVSNPRTRITVVTPRGEVEVAVPKSEEPVRFTSTYSPGVYRVRKRISDSNEPQRSVKFDAMRIATVDASESMLVGVTADRLESLSQTLDANVFHTAAVLQQADRSRSYGREIWRWLLVLLLVALVAELWVQQNLIRRRNASGGMV